jgi:hypothetical protein
LSLVLGLTGSICARAESEHSAVFEQAEAEQAMARAEKLEEADNFKGALAAWDDVDRSYPKAIWPRRLRHLRAYSYFRSGQLERAEWIWGRLLCETNRDALTIQIAFNEALTLFRLGKSELAYWVLYQAPPEILTAKPSSVQRAYFDLAGRIAESLKKFGTAAITYAAASAAVPDAADKAEFRTRFRNVLPLMTKDSDWGMVYNAITDQSLVNLLRQRHPWRPLVLPAAAGATPPDAIEGLKLEPVEVRENVYSSDGRVRTVKVSGHYSGKRALYCGGALIRSGGGSFELELPFAAGSPASAFLLAFTDEAPAQFERREISSATLQSLSDK